MKFLGFIAAALWASAATAAIPRAYRVVALETAVPVGVLYAVALQESRAALGRGVREPWPWTLNVRGVGYRFGSRRAVYLALNTLLKRGETHVDVGLMQVHWRFHAPKLGNSWAALNPYHNLRVGASILTACFRQTGNWTAATGCYHSNTPWRATAYSASVSALMAGVRP